MRSAVLRRSQQALKNHKPPTRHNFSTTLSSSSSSIPTVCQSCRRKLAEPASPSTPQRRWQSSTANSQATTNIPPRASAVPQTHYEFFPKTLPKGPPPSGPFHIDARELRAEFLQLQAVAHPDRHGAHLKLRAEATSARINEAYKTLQNPLLRTQYLLSQRGIDVAEDETAKTEDAELLMEVLDAREEIENAQAEEELVDMKRVNEERIRVSEEVLDGAFQRDDMKVATAEAVRLRYWVNIKESLDAWEKGKPVVLVH
ncbi:hypothetical protein HYALB_00012209 [Hymenoscyphus albidus]|uniref:J domain-containing protein n=1 Tax=Hymenoscyphus albidus TaxID=595503 RepID=A0A9N9Q8A3_9HELO|nr:hypothetical protein HYALB_00012209 [Hymenoscyphus albidus]